MYKAQTELMQNKPMIICLLVCVYIYISEVIQHDRFMTTQAGVTVNEHIKHGYVRLSTAIWLIAPHKIEIHTFFKKTYPLLRTPISAKYCWFGWWLGAWSTSSHHPTQLCDIYISGYKYTLISEWTRLFGLLRILDNLIAGAVCYFCTTISVFCEIYTLRMRVVAHAAIVWVGWFLCRRPELG